jgi:hypothetical protein
MRLGVVASALILDDQLSTPDLGERAARLRPSLLAVT